MDTSLVQYCIQFAYNIGIFFLLAARGGGKTVEQGVEGDNDGDSRKRWVLKPLTDIDCWNDHIADCALTRFFHERRCDTRS